MNFRINKQHIQAVSAVLVIVIIFFISQYDKKDVRTCNKTETYGGIKTPTSCQKNYLNTDGTSSTFVFSVSNKDDQGLVKIKNRAGKIINQIDVSGFLVSDDFPILEFEDYNFDGYDDLSVLTFQAAYNLGNNYYIYDTEEKVFSIFLEEMINSSFNQDERKIYSYNKSRGLGDLYTHSEFSFVDGKYVKTKEITQDMCGSREDMYSNDYRIYVNITSIISDDKVISKSVEYIQLSDDGPNEGVVIPKSKVDSLGLICEI